VPPPAFPPECFDQENDQRTARGGWQWFIEYTTNGRSAMIKRDGWKYCYNHSDLEELYHTAVDPHELHNLADAEEHRLIKEPLKNRLIEWLLVEPNLPRPESSSAAELSASDRGSLPLAKVEI
jgi:arylsulfatase A-like enzyme